MREIDSGKSIIPEEGISLSGAREDQFISKEAKQALGLLPHETGIFSEQDSSCKNSEDTITPSLSQPITEN